MNKFYRVHLIFLDPLLLLVAIEINFFKLIWNFSLYRYLINILSTTSSLFLRRRYGFFAMTILIRHRRAIRICLKTCFKTTIEDVIVKLGIVGGI